MSNRETRYIMGVRVDFGFTLQTAVDHISSKLRSLTPGVLNGSDNAARHIVCTTNPEFLLHATHDNSFKGIINNSLLSIPDGFGVILADEYLRSVGSLNKKSVLFPIYALVTGLSIGISSVLRPKFSNSTVSGVDLVDSLCEHASENNLCVYLLGGWPKDFFGRMLAGDHNIAKAASLALCEKYPGLQVVGATSSFTHTPEDDDKTLKQIKADMASAGVEKIDILFVAYNHPNQEKWLARNIMQIPAVVGIGVGGSFDFIANKVRRAPRFMRRLHLEWLVRMFQQPWRVVRVLSAFPIFPLKVYLRSLKN